MTFVPKKKNTGHMSSTNKDKKFGNFFFFREKKRGHTWETRDK